MKFDIFCTTGKICYRSLFSFGQHFIDDLKVDLFLVCKDNGLGIIMITFDKIVIDRVNFIVLTYLE